MNAKPHSPRLPDRGESHARAHNRQHLLDVLMDGVSDHIYFKDCDSRFVLISRSMADIFDLDSPEDAIGMTDYDFFATDHAKEAFHDEAHVIETGRPIVNKVERETWPDGSVTWVSSTKMPIFGNNDEVIGTFGISRDVTAERLAQEALQKSQTQLAEIMDSITDGFVSLDRQQRITYANPAAEKLLFRNSSLLIGRALTELFPGQVGEDVNGIAIESMTRGEVVDAEVFDSPRQRWIMFRVYPSKELSYVYVRDVTIRRQAMDALKDHQKRLEELVGERTAELTESNTRLQREVAERRRAEAALVQSERLEAISSMASGMAINFSNIIEVIADYADSIYNRTIPGTHAHEEAARIVDAAQRGVDLTNLLTGVGQSDQANQDLKAERVDLGPVVSGAARMLASLFEESNVQIQIIKPETMPCVMAIRNRLQDVIVTFMMNAFEAMPDGGLIRIDCAEKQVDSPDTKLAPKAKPGTYAVLRIRDDGEGIKGRDLSHIFEPFFTTRESDSAKGLGLSYARGFVQHLGGWIAVRSRVGQGTSFRIFIPRAKLLKQAKKGRSGKSKPRTVLVMDDDRAERERMLSACSEIGWDGVAPHTADEAREYIGRNGKHVDAYVFDAHMPNGMTDKLIAHARTHDPSARVLLISGFSREFVRGVTTSGAAGFLQKPFDEQQLTDSIRKICDAQKH